jgi:hypothetical protein
MSTVRSYVLRLVPLSGMGEDPSVGLERLVRYTVLSLRAVSLQYLWISFFPDDTVQQRRTRDKAVDPAVVIQCVVAVVLWWCKPTQNSVFAIRITAYLLFCLYLSLTNILFFSDVPSVNKETTSATRSLLLLAFNVIQVTFTFAIFYGYALHLGRQQAIFGSFLVLGTLGLPDSAAATSTPLVPVHIVANLFLFAFAIAIVVARVPLLVARRNNDHKTGTT